MSSSNPSNRDEGLTLRQAALIAGLAYLVLKGVPRCCRCSEFLVEG